jgi:hypothetical protein
LAKDVISHEATVGILNFLGGIMERFSEFSYGFALVNELYSGILGPSLRGFPIFPSLSEEGRFGMGYDVKLPRQGMPIFFQFKIPAFKERWWANEWYLFGAPYYRIKFPRIDRSYQYVSLRNRALAGDDVYYAAPAFHLARDLNKHFVERSILVNSALFDPKLLREITDHDEHCLVYNEPGIMPPHLLLSEGSPDLDVSHFQKDTLKFLVDKTEEKQAEITAEGLDKIILSFVELLEKVARGTEIMKPPFDRDYASAQMLGAKAAYISYLASTLLDLQFFLFTLE